jgi:hypothetical protein
LWSVDSKKEQLEANVELEKRLSAKDDDSKIGLAVAGDTWWDQVGSQNNYN